MSFVDIRSSGLDRVVVKLFFLWGICLPEAELEKSMGHSWNNRDSHGITVRRLDFWEGGNNQGPH